MKAAFRIAIYFIVIAFLGIPIWAKTQDRIHAYTDLTDHEKIEILVQKLQRSINQENVKGILDLSNNWSIKSTDHTAQLRSKIEETFVQLKTAKAHILSTYGDKADYVLDNFIQISLDQLAEPQSDTAIIICQVYRNIDSPSNGQRVELILVKRMMRFGIVNIDTLLGAVEEVSKCTYFPDQQVLPENEPEKNAYSTKDAPDLFTHKPFYANNDKSTFIDVFNRSSAQATFDGKSIFSRPNDVLETITYDPFLGDNWGMVCSDLDWDRFISFADHDYSGQPAVFGKTHYLGPPFNNDMHGYYYPGGVTLLTDQDLYICDPLNNLIGRYYVNLTSPSLDSMHAIGGGAAGGIILNNPVDIDAAHMPLYLPENTYCTYHNWLAICDQNNNRVVLTGFEGGEEAVIGDSGSGDFHLVHPTSVAFARDWHTGWQTHDVYVADNGNNRIVEFRSQFFGEYESFISTDSGVFDPDAEITSIDVDGFGQVYALDRHAGKIYKFDEDLNLIATWGQIGTDVNSLYHPNRFSITRGWENQFLSECGDEVIVPKRMGELLVTELYSETTGIKRFLFANGLSDFETHYYPRDCNYDTLIGNYVSVDWHQDDYATVRIVLSISNYGVAVDYSGIFLPGDNAKNFGLPPNVPLTGTYTVDIYLISKYTGQVLQHETSSGPYDCGGCNYPPTVVNGPFVTGNDSCFMYNAWPPYECGVDVVDPDDDTADLLYTFITEWCDEEKRIGLFRHPDSTGDPFPLYRDSVVTHSNRIVLVPDRGALPPPPSCPSPPRLKIPKNFRAVPLLIFSVKVQDPNGGWTFRRFTEGDLPFGEGGHTCAPDPGPDTPRVGCPILYVEENGNWRAINNILAESEDANRAADFVQEIYPIRSVFPNDNAEYHLRITEETQDEFTTLQSTRASVIDYPANENVVFTADNSLFALDSKELKPSAAYDATGRDISYLLSYQDHQNFLDYNPGYITVEYDFGPEMGPGPPPDGGPTRPPSEKEWLKPTTDITRPTNGLNTFYALDADGKWILVGKSYPRLYGEGQPSEMSEYIVDNKLTLKIEYGDNIDIDYLPYRFYKELQATPRPLQLVSAAHSQNGEVGAILSGTGPQTIRLEEGQYLDLVFKGTKPPDGYRQMLLLSTCGKYELKNDFNSISAVPEFDQNYPNPFNPTTTFSFSIPAPQHVKLEIFNILGQKVTTLRDNDLPAGRYEVVWDSKNSSGDPVASGVYFARFVSGEYTVSRKIEVLK